jgi:hypothetical protein
MRQRLGMFTTPERPKIRRVVGLLPLLTRRATLCLHSRLKAYGGADLPASGNRGASILGIQRDLAGYFDTPITHY